MTRTREEEIQEAYKDYMDNGGILQSNPWFAFKAGVQWADAHPNFESIWHKASEYPKFEFEYIVYYSSYIAKYETDKPFRIINSYGGIGYSWRFVVKYLGITKWAYITDLLPKTK